MTTELANEMTVGEARERFVGWLARRMTIAGRGDDRVVLEVEPSGKFWLGRLQSEEAVAQSDWGDRGERLEPCAVGMKVRPGAEGPWKVTLSGRARAWLWDRESELWRKTDSAEVSATVLVAPAIGTVSFAEEEWAHALAAVAGKAGLSARFDVEVARGRDGHFELAITLVNSSPSEDKAFRDTRLYECALKVEGLDRSPFQLESLEDSFRYDRNVAAYGINGGFREIDGALVTEDAISVERKRPKYWSVDASKPTTKFADLAEDPITPARTFLTILRSWGDDNWSTPVLDRRQQQEGWAPGMRSKADAAAASFWDECDRIERGIATLETNERLLTSFKYMNEAMVFSSAGRYDEWRPFQFGFLLANLASIVDLDKEPEIVDVVWFATGGGKTETYLGLLVTAAFFDRLRGKRSGITAWSRFPLRMLSLQQTQRFADALAGAETVRTRHKVGGAPFSLGFFVGEPATPNKIEEEAKDGKPDPDDESMPGRYLTLEWCPFCRSRDLVMAFNRKLWKLEHQCGNAECQWFERALPVYIVDEEIYRFLPTIIVGTLDKAALISMQASMRGMVGAPLGKCSKDGHGYTYASRGNRKHGCLVPGCRGEREDLPMDAALFGPSFRLQDELHLLRDSLGAVDSHYEALYDGLQKELCGRKPKILASSATLTGYEKQVDVLYRRDARVFPVPPPRPGGGFWTADSEDLMRHFVAIAPRGVTIEYTVDRLLTELQVAVRELAEKPDEVCAEVGVPPAFAPELLSLYGTNVVYGNTLRDLEAVTRSMETQLQASGAINTASLTGKTDFSEVRDVLERLNDPEDGFYDRLHVITASSMMSHGVDVDRLNVMVMLGIPLTTAEFIQATARVGRKHPGIVFVVHKIGRERDAGVFRSFPQFIVQGDRFVEPIPVTRRSRRVLDRTIAGLELARINMIHEPVAPNPLTTVKTLRARVKEGAIDLDDDMKALIEALDLSSELDEPLKRDLAKWFAQFSDNVELPPSTATFPRELSPTGPPMRSLRDVDTQVPIYGKQFE